MLLLIFIIISVFGSSSELYEIEGNEDSENQDTIDDQIVEEEDNHENHESGDNIDDKDELADIVDIDEELNFIVSIDVTEQEKKVKEAHINCSILISQNIESN